MARLRAEGPVRGFFRRAQARYRPRRGRDDAGPGVRLPEHLAGDWLIWRLVVRQIATYREVREFWDLVEVLAANDALDVQDDADWLASRPKGKPR